MNKIRFEIDTNINYLYHMLSVASCGYDNEYGAKYRPLYPAEELAAFADNSELLTIQGGAHWGELYSLLIFNPAGYAGSLLDYYGEVLATCESIRAGVIPEWVDESLIPYTALIERLSRILLKHHAVYVRDIFPTEREKIAAAIVPVQAWFEANGFTDRAEALIGCELPAEAFTATMVSSVAYGPEAIDLTAEKDLFGIDRSTMDAVYFIGHEFIIYLLKNALQGEDAFRSFATWPLTEALAEYYLKRIMGDTRFFDGQRQWRMFYEQQAPGLTAVQLYRLALQELTRL
ncbi:MAG: hypothetical protein E7318_12605 [Clostridiales bacterium]|nr:hypothetical protein [Clostridiales bacterium]